MNIKKKRKIKLDFRLFFWILNINKKEKGKDEKKMLQIVLDKTKKKG